MSPEAYAQTSSTLMWLLTAAWLLPLLGFLVEIFAGYWGTRTSKTAAYLAVGCIGAGFLLSCAAASTWLDAAHVNLWAFSSGEHEAAGHGASGHGAEHPAGEHPKAEHAPVEGPEHPAPPVEGSGTPPRTVPPESQQIPPKPDPMRMNAIPRGPKLLYVATLLQETPAEPAAQPEAHVEPAAPGDGGAAPSSTRASAPQPAAHGNNPYKAAFAGTYYQLGKFGPLEITLDYYIDGLTILMFVMVTLIATCIHVFAIGYMSDELTEHYEDHFVHTHDGGHFHRPGRFYRFFAFLSLFSFSMLGLVLAGNIFQVFIFWELVGVCSYLLIGFYVERHSASTAANKAFIMNRVGDFGFLVGLMILWTWMGTFQFAVTDPALAGKAGLFQMVRSPEGKLTVRTTSGEPATMADGANRLLILQQPGVDGSREMPYWLLIVAGLGIFAGCIGKSAQFPLQTWLPDAMEGPTPVSALVHSATMVAAGVYLTGRFYPMFTPEVLLIISYIGCITLFIGATIAIVVTDIKRVLAYSTISQLGYMMLGLGVGGWMAGLLHLITHAFFKSLMFLASGSVIHGCHHEQDMTRMGGLYKKMPVTCWTMFVGVVAICGLAIPGITLGVLGPIAFSGYHSKDAVVASALTFSQLNPGHSLLFLIPLLTAGITAFYMFRMWFMTFFGKPRDHHVYEHAHESPRIMTLPLVVLSFFAIFVAIGGESGPLATLILQSEPAHLAEGFGEPGVLAFPSHHQIHEHHAQAGTAALLVAFLGTLLSFLLYATGRVDVSAIARSFASVHAFLLDKWRFDVLYEWLWVKPVHVIARWASAFDKTVLDGLISWLAKSVVDIATWDRKFDEAVVDRLVNVAGEATFAAGRSLRRVQTGQLRQYVMFIAVSVVSLFLILFILLPGH